MANDKNHNGSNGAANLLGEAIRYFKNGRGIIRKIPIRNNKYEDAKPICEASGVIYRGLLKAIEAFAMQIGKDPAKLKSYNDYILLLKRHSIHNGKLKDAFIDAYTILHVAVYYRDETNVEVVKRGIQNARFVIEKLTGKRIS